MSAWLRVGECSVCRCAIEAQEGNLAGPLRARSRAIRRQPRGHWHRAGWRLVRDAGPDLEGWRGRGWQDVARFPG